mmetsp:Transcript_2192/g.2863  ORF Transcript_2192/g.2863 Transcript_2192/m.2863 type:complete len:343 (+) Transcript_2192:69-1097(+)
MGSACLSTPPFPAFRKSVQEREPCRSPFAHLLDEFECKESPDKSVLCRPSYHLLRCNRLVGLQGESLVLRQRDLQELAVHTESVHRRASLLSSRSRSVRNEAAASGEAVRIALHVRRRDLAEWLEELHKVCLGPFGGHIEDVAGSLSGGWCHLAGTTRRLAVKISRLLPLDLAAQYVLVEGFTSRTQVLCPMSSHGHHTSLGQTIHSSLHRTFAHGPAAATAPSASTARSGAAAPAAASLLLASGLAALLLAAATALALLAIVDSRKGRQFALHVSALAFDHDFSLHLSLNFAFDLALNFALKRALGLNLLLNLLFDPNFSLHASLLLHSFSSRGGRPEGVP